jgi:hypothetical protein
MPRPRHNSSRKGVQRRSPTLKASLKTPAKRPRRDAGVKQSVPFEVEVLDVLRTLSRALAGLLAALPGNIGGPRELQRALAIDYVLAWRTYRVATATDPGAVGADVPRAAPMNRLLAAAAAKGVDPAVLARVRRACRAFEDLVSRHAGEGPKRGPRARIGAGGRAFFDALVGGVHEDAAKPLSLVHRRDAYNANSFIWGLQCHTTAFATISHRGASEAMIDVEVLLGFVGLSALRKNVPLRLMYNLGACDASGGSDGDPVSRPMMPSGQASILSAFSSNPLPRIQSTPGALGAAETNICFDEVGRAGAVDLFTAGFTRDRYASKPQPWFGAVKGCSVPCELMIVDMLLPRGWTRPDSVRALTHGTVALYEGVGQRLPEFEMPVKEEAVYLGTDIGALEIPEIPQYGDLVRSRLKAHEWSSTVFDVYRVRVLFPIMHAFVNLRVDAAPHHPAHV